MTLYLHRAPRTDQLADALGDLLATPLADPFASEVVVVPAKGVERWLSQRLSHRLGAATGRDDGVCAGVDFTSPRSLFAVVSGRPDDDPWAADALTWPLLQVIDASVAEPWAATLARHLGHAVDGDDGELRRGRRFATARRLAALFASYAAQRPALVADWAAGRDLDGAGGPVPADLLWQPELWRRLAAAVGAPDPARRQVAAIEKLRLDPGSVALPARVNLFGHTRLATGDLELLDALAAEREVHLWLPHPSEALWSRLDDLRGAVPRVDDTSHLQVGHPLLATLGRDTRELQRALAAHEVVDEPLVSRLASLAPQPAGETLLGWLQHDLRSNAPGNPATRVVATTDRSVQLHACHGPARQVEVLREVLLGLLADDPMLEPRDVLVMCPDIEGYAPLLSAAFGLADVVGPEGHPAHRLRVSLADRALDQTNPLLAVVARVLDLAGGRAGVGAVLDLAHAEPVRRRFGFRDDDLDLLATWVAQAGVKWGFDAEHRTEFGLQAYGDNTWRSGLDRLLSGIALSDDSDALLGDVLPLDDVGSGDIDLIGRLSEFVARLESVTDRLVGTHPLDHWLDTIEEGVGSLTSVRPADAWQLGQVQRELDGLRSAAGSDVDLRLPDVRAMFGDRLAGRPTRANFRTGVLTVSTLVPMRSVPHRVVCLLGLDDGVFPRVGVTDGDDVLARRPMTGERDPRSEDRQLLLDAVLAATDTLVITYTGANEFTGQARPPAVPVGELLDALDLTASTSDGRSVSEQVRIKHPLQPFDRRNLKAGALVPGHAFAFDRFALAGARAVERDREEPPPFLAGELPPPVAGDVALDDLVEFYGGPVKGFLKQRLGIALPREDEPVDDRIPIALDALEEWAVGDRILGDLMRGHHPDAAVLRERRRGVVPPGELGDRILQKVIGRARPLAIEALAHTGSAQRAVDVDVDLGGGRRLRGTVPELHGDLLVRVSYSKLGPKHRLHSWIKLLALAASDQDRAWRGLTIGRPETSRGDLEVSRLAPLDHRALGWLRDLVALRDEGLVAPLPLPLKSSIKYARARRTNTDASVALDRVDYQAWRYDGRYEGERLDAEYVLVWGDKAPLPGTNEPGEADEPHRFGAVAMRVWSPLLESEVGSW
ncbi:exodeoxyribonuclease V subunit gamma [Nocardioides humilatus]|uniref:RecBCD enzyme subunit RecC n=1 Tax=Nocardioides humilatus TaxID=2607660 RepID=A0A5B1LM62_9ACTN|nr:exodeoxyribonuclease V subunit gamma [Nocardioides humilatus]KAA1421772.1 exodeoxyribonuclease V subunit gamma [Nocardioides humilatus]